MFQKLHKGDKKTFVVSLICVFLAASVVLLISTMLIHAQTNRNARLKIDISEQSLIDAEQYVITYKINRLTSDLQFIYETLETHYSEGTDIDHIAKLWLSYSNSRRVFDQIRFIDSQGDEIIRVDYSAEGAFIVPEDALQNKKDRYYFQQTLDLNADQIYVSSLDLNIENGAIEQPLNPVIRFARPFFDQDGVKQGIVILNYSASDILAQIASVAQSSYGEVHFLNKEGYWLYNSDDHQSEWAFSYSKDSEVRFPTYFEKEWETISAGGSGSLSTENGYFRYVSIPFDTICLSNGSTYQLSSEIGNWYMVSHIPTNGSSNVYPSNRILDLAGVSIRQYAPLYAMLVVFSAVLAGFITSSRTKSKEVKFFSEYDVMTNAYNRHAGIDKLSDLYHSLTKSNCYLSVCFIDINGLKVINDTLGHESGDELIITVAKTIRSMIRTNDFLIRLGGDEFLIVFQGIDAPLAEDVWARIVEAFEQINRTEHRKYLISVSHGIKTLHCSLNQALDNLLHEADTAMYDEKRRIKLDLKIIRD